jgi:ABC-2 type transport system ATP-binding protein
VRALRAAHGLTVLLTTHRPEEAEQCDRLAVMDGGRLVACDTPGALVGRVGGDVIVVEAPDPEAVAALLQRELALPARVHDGRVVLERREGHTLIPRLVEAVPAGRLTSVSLRRPTLADAFLALTTTRDGQR